MKRFPLLANALKAQRARRRGRGAQGFTLTEVVAAVTLLGIIIVPLGMAMIVALKTTTGIEQRLGQSADAQLLANYFTSDVQAVDAQGVNPADPVNINTCAATGTETPLILLISDQDLGVSAQTVVRYIASGKGSDSKIIRRSSTGGAECHDVTVARNFGSEPVAPATVRADATTFLKSNSRTTTPTSGVYVATPDCAGELCYFEIHGTYNLDLTVTRRVPGSSGTDTADAPTNVHGLGGNHKVVLYWDKPADPEGNPITGYAIEKTCNNVTTVLPGPYPVGSAPEAGTLISGLTNGDSCTFRVRAINTLGGGQWSEPSPPVTPGPEAPSAPTIGTASASADITTPESAAKATVTWSKPGDFSDGGGTFIGWRVLAQPADGDQVTFDVNDPTGNMTSAVVDGLVANTRYTFQVTALTDVAESASSAASNEIITLPGKPGISAVRAGANPGELVLTFGQPTGGDPATIDQYRVNVYPPTGAPIVTTVAAATACPGGTDPIPCTATVTGLPVGPSYTVRAQAHNTYTDANSNVLGGWGVESDAAVNVDITPPVVSLTAPVTESAFGGPNFHQDAQSRLVTFSGTRGTDANDLAPITVRVYRGGDVSPTGLVATLNTPASDVGATWSIAWTAPANLADGSYAVIASQADSGGNVGTSGISITIDTTGPTPTVVTPADGATVNTAKPVFSGLAGTQVGANADAQQVTLRIYDGANTNGTLEFILNATRGGPNWSIGLPGAVTLPDGQYTVQATQVDLLGNSGLSDPVTFVVDNNAPVVTITQPTNNLRTNDATPTISGTAGNAPGPVPSADSPTVTVTLYAGSDTTGSVVRTLTTTRTGTNWTLTPATDLADGTYTAVASQQNAAGNQGDSSPVTFTVATHGPTVIITDPADGSSTADTTPTISGTAGNAAGDATTVDVLVYAGSTTTGAPVRGLTATRTGTSWTVDVTSALADGTYTAQASQTDVLGTLGQSNTVTFVIDTSGPAVTITTPANNSATNNNRPTFSGVAGNAGAPNPDGTQVTVRIYDGPDTSGTLENILNATRGGAAWTITSPSALADGQYTVQAEQDDSLGNVSLSNTRTFVVDTAAPTVTITTPATGTAGSDNTPTLSGTAGTNAGPVPTADSNTVTVRIYAGSTATGTVLQTRAATRTGGTWTIDATTLPDGIYTAQATQLDAVNNSGVSNSTTFTVNTTGPTVTITAPGNNTYGHNTKPTFTGTAGNAGAPNPDDTLVQVKIYAGANTSGTLVNIFNATRGGTAWSITSPVVLPDGQYTAQAEQANSLGNVGVSNTVTFIIDTVAPTATPTITGTLGNNGWYTTNVNVVWNTADNVGVNGALTNCPVGNATTDTAGVTYNCQVTDLAGNVANFSQTIKVDKTGPVVPAPTITGTLGTNSWYRSNVTVTWAPTDAMSGIATTCSANSVTTDTAGTSFTCTATDNAGNSTTSAAVVVKRDTVAPSTATLTALPSVIRNGQALTATGADATSGVGSVTYLYCTGAACTPATTAGTSAVGPNYTFTWNGQPADGATYRVMARVTDAAGNTLDSAIQTIAIDNTKPTTTGFLLSNGGAAAGTLEVNDFFEVTYSEALNTASLCTGLTGANPVTGQSITLNQNGNGSDTLSAPAGVCANAFSNVALSGNYYTGAGTVTLTATYSWIAATNRLRVTITALSTTTNRAVGVGNGTPTYSNTTNIADVVGNTMNASTVPGTSSRF